MFLIYILYDLGVIFSSSDLKFNSELVSVGGKLVSANVELTESFFWV